MAKNGVIDKTTGDLLRAGYCDFLNDGQFNAATESYRTDVPAKAKIFRGKGTEYHKWTGTEWILVSNGRPILSGEILYRTEEFSGNRLTEACHYTTEINAAIGFSGFSGLGRKDKYTYQGNILLGFSSIFYDTLGQVVSVTTTNLSTGPNGKYIYREQK